MCLQFRGTRGTPVSPPRGAVGQADEASDHRADTGPIEREAGTGEQRVRGKAGKDRKEPARPRDSWIQPHSPLTRKNY